MVPVTVDEVNGLNNGNRYILFEVNDEKPGKAYHEVLKKIVLACTGKTPVPHRNRTEMSHIPVIEGDGFFVIHVRGLYRKFRFDHRLLCHVGSNYFQAIQTNFGWRQVFESRVPIQGAFTYRFNGSYTEWYASGDGDVEGLSTNNVKLGIDILMGALMTLIKGNNDVKAFLTVCVNLFEAARYPKIGGYVSQHRFGEGYLTSELVALIYGWGDISDAVRKYGKEGWTLQGDVALYVNEVSVKRILAMANKERSDNA